VKSGAQKRKEKAQQHISKFCCKVQRADGISLLPLTLLTTI